MPDMRGPGPRLFVIVATEAPVAAVVRRGPSDWCHVGRWHLDDGDYESGAWLKGTIYPQKCDLSPDGRWFAYSALKYPGDWAAGPVFEAVSRLPWLAALAAWEAGTTYTRGVRFTHEAGECALGEPDVGDAQPLLVRYGLALRSPVKFAIERQRGWHETADTPPREAGGPWDEDRAVEMMKPRPGRSDTVLRVSGSFAGMRTMPDWHEPASYVVGTRGGETVLPGVQWADWNHDGRLLVATIEGHLQIRVPPFEGDTVGGHVHMDVDLSALRPDPNAPPSWALSW